MAIAHIFCERKVRTPYEYGTYQGNKVGRCKPLESATENNRLQACPKGKGENGW